MGNQAVTFEAALDHVFSALSHPTRRRLLDDLRRADGQTLSALQARYPVSRIAVMKHLDVLARAGLITRQRHGRQTTHHLNVMPMRVVYDRWMRRYFEQQPWTSPAR
jgi:DNA-binding transcriptional ArsR family regulator